MSDLDDEEADLEIDPATVLTFDPEATARRCGLDVKERVFAEHYRATGNKAAALRLGLEAAGLEPVGETGRYKTDESLRAAASALTEKESIKKYLSLAAGDAKTRKGLMSEEREIEILNEMAELGTGRDKIMALTAIARKRQEKRDEDRAAGRLIDEFLDPIRMLNEIAEKCLPFAQYLALESGVTWTPPKKLPPQQFKLVPIEPTAPVQPFADPPDSPGEASRRKYIQNLNSGPFSSSVAGPAASAASTPSPAALQGELNEAAE